MHPTSVTSQDISSKLTPSRNSTSYTGAKNLKMLREQGQFTGKKIGADSSRGVNRLSSAAIAKDYYDMLNVEKVIFKNDFKSLKGDQTSNQFLNNGGN